MVVGVIRSGMREEEVGGEGEKGEKEGQGVMIVEKHFFKT